MKYHKHTLYLYLGVVVLPVIIFSIFYYNKILQDHYDKRKDYALWIASIYQENWDQFISETVTSLNILSLSAEANLDTPEKMRPLLNRIHQSDPRYGGLYLLNNQGNVLSGSDSLRLHKDASSLKYIQEVIKTKDTIISDEQEILFNSNRVIGLATPVTDDKQQLKAILVAYLRIDYMKNLMKVLTPESSLYFINGSGQKLLEMNISDLDLKDQKNWVTKPMDHLPWIIKVKIEDPNWKEIGKQLAQGILLFLVITNVLYFMIEYVLLRRNSHNERKENEVQKLELVGTLAASTAHEIRNPLTGVKGLMQLLSEKYTDKEDRYYFEVINTELNRINEIVSEFLILGKPTAQTTNGVNIVETLKELKPLIISEGNLFNVDFTWTLPAEPVMVQCVKDQLKQVILNITKNAFESIEGSGTLEINLISFENTCKLKIIDNGKGISKEDLEKLFRPFYTSKDTGTGLGLVVCKRIINSFGGSIQIFSQESIGTTVEITLPIEKMR